MLNLLHISDWHTNGDSFRRRLDHEIRSTPNFVQPDVIVMSGDMVINTSNYYDNKTVEGEIQRMHFTEMLDYCWQIFPGIDVIGVRGNHDFFDYEIPGDHHSGVDVFELAGYKFASVRGMPQYVGSWNDEYPESKLALAASAIPDDTNILITHAPPFGVLDDANDVPENPLAWGNTDLPIPVIQPNNVGSSAFRIRVMELQYLKLHMFGHVHEQGGKVETRNDVIYSNAACTANVIYLP